MFKKDLHKVWGTTNMTKETYVSKKKHKQETNKKGLHKVLGCCCCNLWGMTNTSKETCTYEETYRKDLGLTKETSSSAKCSGCCSHTLQHTQHMNTRVRHNRHVKRFLCMWTWICKRDPANGKYRRCCRCCCCKSEGTKICKKRPTYTKKDLLKKRAK